MGFWLNKLENHMALLCPVREAERNRRNEQLCWPVWWVRLWKNHHCKLFCPHQPQAWRAALSLLYQQDCMVVFSLWFLFSPQTCLPWLSFFYFILNYILVFISVLFFKMSPFLSLIILMLCSFPHLASDIHATAEISHGSSKNIQTWQVRKLYCF